MNAPAETQDSICGVQIIQRARGYRFNLDSVLLARFAVDGLDASKPLRVIDLGTGSGVVACLIAKWRPKWHVSAVEVQPGMAELARRNAALNGLAVEVIESDWRKLGSRSRTGDADLVVCNPPYHPPTGKTPANPERAAAKQELHGDLTDAIGAAARLARGNGSVRFICAAGRLADMVVGMREASLGISRVRMIHPHAGDAANSFLIESVRASKRPTLVLPPLIVHDSAGAYTPEVTAMLLDS